MSNNGSENFVGTINITNNEGLYPQTSVRLTVPVPLEAYDEFRSDEYESDAGFVIPDLHRTPEKKSNNIVDIFQNHIINVEPIYSVYGLPLEFGCAMQYWTIDENRRRMRNVEIDEAATASWFIMTLRPLDIDFESLNRMIYEISGSAEKQTKLSALFCDNLPQVCLDSSGSLAFGNALNPKIYFNNSEGESIDKKWIFEHQPKKYDRDNDRTPYTHSSDEGSIAFSMQYAFPYEGYDFAIDAAMIYNEPEVSEKVLDMARRQVDLARKGKMKSVDMSMLRNYIDVTITGITPTLNI